MSNENELWTSPVKKMAATSAQALDAARRPQAQAHGNQLGDLGHMIKNHIFDGDLMAMAQSQ